MLNTVPRKIYFHRIRITPNDDGTVPEFDVREASTIIQSLQFLHDTGPLSRYMTGTVPEEVVGVWPVFNESHTALCIGTVRRGGLPHVEEAGKISPLQIEDPQGLLEWTHVVFFPDGIVGAEFNFYAPRLTRLSDYLIEKCPLQPRVAFLPLLHRDAQEQFTHLDTIRTVQLRLHRSRLDLLMEANESLPAALRATGEQWGAEVIEIVLRPGARRRTNFKKAAWDFVQNLIGKQEQLLDGSDLFRVRGRDDRTGKTEVFDFLKDQFVSTRQVVKQKGKYRAVDSASMFREIETAYNEMRDSLTQACGVSL
jgi:hypothetical protein